MPICPKVKYAGPLLPPRKAISGPSLIAAGTLLGGEGREKNVRQFTDEVRPRWDRIDVVCLLLSFAASSTVSSDQSQGQVWPKAG